MARCGCASALCTCTIVGDGDNVDVSGLGSASNPYTIAVTPAKVTVANTGTINMGVTGDGSVAHPYVVSANAKFSPSGNMLVKGIRSMNFASNGTVVTAHVNFPAGTFTNAPSVCVTPSATTPQNWAVSVSAVDNTGFDLNATRLAGSSTGNDMHWIAVGT